MRLSAMAIVLTAILCIASTGSRAANDGACPTDPAAPGITQVVTVPTKGGPAYGGMQYPRGVDLEPRQVALTFDDGPDPETTRRVLDILDRHCVKATFFMVGYYAEKHPEIVREVAARGHVIGTHTWLHLNMRKLTAAAAQREIRRGFEAVEAALASAPPDDQARLAPFFRFPGLNDSAALIRWLGDRHVATFSCEFGADDWKAISSAEVRRRAIHNIAYVGRGILILHDTKPRTADMLSDFIVTLRAQGYSFVQLAPEPADRALAAAASDAMIAPMRALAALEPASFGVQDTNNVADPSLEPASALH